jgi:hypothetical protein
MVAPFDLDLSGLVLDMTNFATYIDSANERGPIAQRGHATQKHYHLRLVGLALMVNTDGGIPLLSHAYGGNRNDVTQLADVLSEMVTRWGALAKKIAQLTLVYDAGQDSQANQSAVEANPLHFVDSLRPTGPPARGGEGNRVAGDAGYTCAGHGGPNQQPSGTTRRDRVVSAVTATWLTPGSVMAAEPPTASSGSISEQYCRRAQPSSTPNRPS